MSVDVSEPEVGTPRVSVVVPTYAPGERITGLVRSLENQTLPASEFEVIFVDDGSPGKDTWTRLQQIRDTHDNVRIERIENSGWPSRPRNVGLELARGQYVLFMDHDDELYPRALEAGYAMAARTGADVLNGKETRTDQPKWALEVYTENFDNAIDRQDIHPLIPTNPHKLFRRALLMKHGIRFPEGRRVLWEDVFFALDVAQHAKVISVMSDTPFYHWVRKGKTASSSYQENIDEYWRWVREIVLQTNEKLAAPELRGQWRLMLLHQYRSRILAVLGTSLFKAPAEDFELVRRTVDELIGNHIPAELDQYLTPTQLGRAALLRKGRWDLLKKLVAVDSGLLGVSTATSLKWTQGTLQMTAESRWSSVGAAGLAIRYDADRLVRDLPGDVMAELPPQAIDMEDAVHAASTGFAIRARDTGLTWMLPGQCEPRIDVVDGRPELVVSATGLLDPQTAVFGRPLDETSWDVTTRNELVGTINQRGLRTSIGARPCVRNGRVYIAYRAKTKTLSLDVDERYRSLVGSARLDPKRVRVTVSAPGRIGALLAHRPISTFELPFTGVATSDDIAVAADILLQPSPQGQTPVIEKISGKGLEAQVWPAKIVPAEDGVWLVATIRKSPGTYLLTLLAHARSLDTGLDVTVAVDGNLSFAERAG